jgi:hypothetical protein
LKTPVPSQVSSRGINGGKIPNETVLSESINFFYQNPSTNVPYSYIHFHLLYTKGKIKILINIPHKLQLIKYLEEKTFKNLNIPSKSRIITFP